MTLDYSIEIIEDDTIQSFITERNHRAIGLWLETQIIVQMSQLDKPLPVMSAFSKDKVITVSLNQETHSERHQAAREAGRLFAQELGDQLVFIAQCMATWHGSEESGHTASEDPARSEGALTFVSQMDSFYQCQTMDEHLDALKGSWQWAWLVQMHEGTPGEVIYDCTPVKPSSAEEADSSSDSNDIAYIDNFILNETVIGLIA